MTDEGARVRRQVASIRARFPADSEEETLNIDDKLRMQIRSAQEADKAARQEAMSRHNEAVIEHAATVRALELEKLQDDARQRKRRHAAELEAFEVAADIRRTEFAARKAERDYWTEKRDDARGRYAYVQPLIEAP